MDLAAMIVRWGIRPYLYGRYYFEKITHTGGFGNNRATYIKHPPSISGNRLKYFLHQYHVKQFHESSCSVASVASVINAILAQQGNLPATPVTQQELLEKVRVAHWKERMSENGHNGRRGLPLEILGQVVKKSLDEYRIFYRSVEIISAGISSGEAHRFKQELWERLERFESGSDSLLIAHFNQGRFLPELHIPHISPVGAFEGRTSQVTILDVDPDQKWPYKIPFEIFYQGISCNYNHIFRPFGYAGGGYILIQL